MFYLRGKKKKNPLCLSPYWRKYFLILFHVLSIKYTIPIMAKNSFVAEILHVHENYACVFQFRDAQIIDNNLKLYNSLFFAWLSIFVRRRINKPLTGQSFQYGEFLPTWARIQTVKIKSHLILHSLCRKTNNKEVWSVPQTSGAFDGIFPLPWLLSPAILLIKWAPDCLN